MSEQSTSPAPVDADAAVSSESGDLETDDDGAYKIRRVTFPLVLPNGGYFGEDGRQHAELELTPLSGEEEDILMDEKLNRSSGNEPVRRVLANCIRRLGDFTLPAFVDRKKEDKELALQLVDGLTLNDNIFALVMLRRISLLDGDHHKFPHKCSKCDREFTAVVDLSDLEVRPAVNDGAPKVFKLPQSGRVVRYRNLLVADSDKLIQMVKQHSESLPSMSLYLRIVDIDGKKVPSHRDLRRLSTIDREALREEMNATEGGLDLILTIPCPDGHIDHDMLRPDASFFLPSLQASERRPSKAR